MAGKPAAKFLNYFETLNITAQPKQEQLLILEQALNKFNKKTHITAGADTLDLILQLAERFPALGHLPAAGIAILDESLALAQVKILKISARKIF